MAENKTAPRMINVVVGIPKDGKTEPAAYDNRLEMLFHLGALQACSRFGKGTLDDTQFAYPEDVQFKFFTATVGKVYTPLAREKIADFAVDSGADYLFMIDDDMMAPQDLFERLFTHNVDIVAALAFNRYAPHKPVCFEVKSGYDPVEKKEYFANYPILSYPRNTLVECDAVGFGAVLIKVDVLRKLRKPWFMVMTGAGEDIHFCWKAKKEGFKVFMDTATKLGHLGDPIEITEENFDEQENQKKLYTH